MLSPADHLSQNPPFSINQISKPRKWAQIADNEVQGLMQQLQVVTLDSTGSVITTSFTTNILK